MNNGLLQNVFTDDAEIDRIPLLRSRESELLKIIEAVNVLITSSEWKVVKTLVFDTISESLESKLHQESKKSELNMPEIYRLQGQILSAKKYFLEAIQDQNRSELKNLRKLLHDKK